MSSLTFLVTELQSLATETRRKHPEVREAAEKSIAILRASPEQATASLASDGPQAQDLLRPVFMGCATKNAKVVGMALGSLQRLIALRAVPASAVPTIVTTMAECASGGVDIQLRILQTLLSLVTNFAQLHGAMLGSALLLCFKLHESRIAVVSSTAAATLRQLVMFVVDKVVDEDKRHEVDEIELTEVSLPDGSSISLGVSACDAYAVFEDLCLLANSERPKYLQLDSLPKTFALELIESVVTNYHNLFRQHRELRLLLRHHLSPLLLKILSDRPSFPLMLRSTRVVFLLLKQFTNELDTEAEVFFMLLIKIIGGEPDLTQHGELPHTRPTWMRVMALEIMRGLCTDAELMRCVWDRFDAHPDGSSVFTSLASALKRLITEKPAILGVCQQLHGVGVQVPTDAASGGSGVGSMAGMVANAATATVSGVVGMIASGPGLSVQTSAMKLQCIDQLDKADVPPIPEGYIYLLGVQCLVSLSDGFATFSGPLFTSIVKQRTRAAGDPAIRAPAALDVKDLPVEEPSTKALTTVKQMVETAWPALLAALSFVITTNLSDDLFVEVLASYQALTNVAGMFGLSTPRDAFFASLAKYAIPTRVVTSVQSYVEPPTPRTATSISDNLGLSGATGPPGLSDRNLACLKVFISSAIFLAGSLDESWFDILETLQNADYVLTPKGARGGRSGLSAPALSQRKSSMPTPSLSTSQPPAIRHPLLSDLDLESVIGAIQRLFEASKSMDDPAFKHFVSALARLSLTMVGMQTPSPFASASFASAPPSKDDLTIQTQPSSQMLGDRPVSQRRRVSGIHLQPDLRSGDFAITKLGAVALSNVNRLIHRSSEVAWDTIIPHLLLVLRSPLAPQSIRTQAAKVLDEILMVVPRHIAKVDDRKADVQRQVVDALFQQVVPDPVWDEASSVRVELSRMGLETLHEILQAFGHTLLVGWETIFEMLRSVCQPPVPASLDLPSSTNTSAPSSPSKGRRPPALGLANERSYATLIKTAFKSLQLVCDSLSVLTSVQLRECVATIGQFGRQPDTNIALTAAESLLWSVSDAIQTKRKESGLEEEYDAIWMLILFEVLSLCTDERSAVRIGAIQTLFRTLQLYGASLTLDIWEECIWKVTFPLLESLNKASGRTVSLVEEGSQSQDQAWDDSKVLALQSVGSMFAQFLATKVIRLQSFEQAWDSFAQHIQHAVLADNRAVSSPALRCLDSSVQAALQVSDPPGKERRSHISRKSWEVCEKFGNRLVAAGGSSTSGAANEEETSQPYSQDSLVALVDLISSIRINDGSETWPAERMAKLMEILKGVLTYPHSLDFRPDVDMLSPVQVVVLNAVKDIPLNDPSIVSLVIKDLSAYATLPFLAAFDAPQVMYIRPGENAPKPSSSGRKRVTYVGLTKQVMPLVVETYTAHAGHESMYSDGTVEAMFSALAIPIKMKYDCPPASKFGKEPPLWKTATNSFLRIVQLATMQLAKLEDSLTDERFESIWHQIIDVYRAGILADCSAAENLDPTDRKQDEEYDRAWLASLEADVIPHISKTKVPASLVGYMAEIVQEASRLHEYKTYTPTSSIDESSETSSVPSDRLEQGDRRSYDNPTTDPGTLFPRERFAYWSLDLLFQMCSSSYRPKDDTSRRLVTIALPSLMQRCRTPLLAFISDGSLRGDIPFSRTREEEVLQIIRKLLELRLWPGSMWAARSNSPSQYWLEQPGPDTSLPLAELVRDAVRRSTIAHLFELYPLLCEIASSTRTAVAWMPLLDNGGAEEFDARTLASQCLEEIGKELN